MRSHRLNFDIFLSCDCCSQSMQLSPQSRQAPTVHSHREKNWPETTDTHSNQSWPRTSPPHAYYKLNKMTSSNVILFLLPLLALQVSAQGPIVDTTYGPVQGVDVTLNSGNVIQTFMGVPYARPPVGDLRFEVGLQYVWRHRMRWK